MSSLLSASSRWWRSTQTWKLSRLGVPLVLITVALTAAFRASLDPVLGGSALLLAFVLPVTICAALGGCRVGLFATAVSLIAGLQFFILPVEVLQGAPRGELTPATATRMLLFVVIGVVISIVSGRMHSEIDQSHRAKLALLDSEARLRLTLTAAQAGTWDWDIPNDRHVWSEANYDLLGLEPSREASFSAWREALHPDDRERILSELDQRLASSSDAYRVEYRIVHPERGIRWLLALGQIHRDERGKPARLIGLNLDITERRNIEEAERIARAEAERASKLKDEFVATLSHELRTPLTAVLGWAQVLRRNQDVPEKINRGLEVIERNGRALSQVVSDLLDVSRIVTDKLRLDLAPTNLAAVVEPAVEALRHAAEAKGLRLDVYVAPGLDPFLADATRLSQVVWNLLSNAFKFTPAGGRVELRASIDGGAARIIVSDTGEGIAPDFLPHLFQRFRQEDSSSSRKYGGLGLGLSIVRHIVELHGGVVSAASPGSGLGATFIVEFPALAASLPGLPPNAADRNPLVTLPSHYKRAS